MFEHRPYNPGPYDDDLADQPAQSEFHRWGLGVLIPIAMGVYGIRIFVVDEATMGSRISMVLRGENAIAYGIAALSLALFLHCHYYWGERIQQAWFAVLGKIVSAAVFILGLGFVFVRAGVLGQN